jgi:hypothetical protein
MRRGRRRATAYPYRLASQQPLTTKQSIEEQNRFLNSRERDLDDCAGEEKALIVDHQGLPLRVWICG